MSPGHLLGYLSLGATALGGIIWGIAQKGEDQSDKVTFLEAKIRMLESEVAELEEGAPVEAPAPTSPPPTPDEIAERAEAYRELTFKEKPVFKAVPREVFEAALEEDVRRALPDDGGADLMEAFIQIGFVFDPDEDSSFDMVESFTGLRLGQENALFDPETNTITYPEDTELRDAGERSRLTAAAISALQHQYFGEISTQNSDAAIALTGLRTGEIGQITLRISLLEPEEIGAPPPSPEATAPFYGAPVFLRETNLFPHIFGTRFVGELHGKDGWKTVNSAYERPPRSSAEIMHPELYASGFTPESIALDTAPLLGEPALASDVAGELGINLLLQTLTAPRTSMLAATGWSGDRWVCYPSGYAWETRWTSEQDAIEFHAQMQLYLERRYELEATPFDEDGAAISESGTFIQLSKNAQRVTIRTASSQAFAQALDTTLKQ